jgi:hypothetical protein
MLYHEIFLLLHLMNISRLAMDNFALKEITKRFETFRAYALIIGTIAGVLLVAPVLNLGFNVDFVFLAAVGVVICEIVGLVIVEMFESSAVVELWLKTRASVERV